MINIQKGNLRTITGVLFLIPPACSILIDATGSLFTYLWIAGMVLASIAVFKEKYKYLAVAAGLIIVSELDWLVWNVSELFDGYLLSFGHMMSSMLLIGSWVLFAMASLSSNTVKTHCLIAAVLRVLSCLLENVLYLLEGIGLGSMLLGLIFACVNALAVALVGVILDSKKVIQMKAVAKTNNANSLIQADSLIKLKKLLDNNIISQEEFDEKKKQILKM